MVPRRRYAAIVAVLLVGCSSDDGSTSESTVRGVHTTASQTSGPSTPTIDSTTTTSTSSTIAEIVLPVPQPPPDPYANEPELQLGSIEIPRLGLTSSLFEGIAIPTLNKGPGHWPGTALPGMVGNIVVGGHRTSKSKPFRHLELLVPGDEVIFTTDAGRFVYYVVGTEIVTPDSMWVVDQTEAYTGTLFACNPVGSTTERIVVFLEM